MSNGINQIGIPKFQHPWRSLQTSRNSGTWGDRGKGNELQQILKEILGMKQTFLKTFYSQNGSLKKVEYQD